LARAVRRDFHSILKPQKSMPLQHHQSNLQNHIAQRSAFLTQVAADLKTELFGIDSIIDRVMESVRAWYIVPELINRPVIVCLWGLTGTDKTQLTRRLAQKLGFYDKFVEVQMDGFSNSITGQCDTISGTWHLGA